MEAETMLEAELNKLLGEDVSSVIERERTAFDKIVEPFGKSFVLFGAGNLGRKVLSCLRQDGTEPLAFADNNHLLWGKCVEGIQVLPPHEAAEKFGRQAAFLVTIWNPRSNHRFILTKQQLRKLNCERVVSFVPLAWKYADTFLPDCYMDLPHKIYADAESVRSTFAMWADEKSRITYVTQLKWRILADFDELPGRTLQQQYFPEDVVSLSPDEIFVDCGACDGDTIREFLSRTGSNFVYLYAIEPDPLNFESLLVYVNSLPGVVRDKITLLQQAAGKQKQRLRFAATGNPSSHISVRGNIEVDCIDLDSILGNSLPTYIKMDIEGSESDALIGARKAIEEAQPVLAVCVYHRQDHLWRIPLLIRAFSSQYRFFLRPHAEEGWDTVCYAVPDNRSNN